MERGEKILGIRNVEVRGLSAYETNQRHKTTLVNALFLWLNWQFPNGAFVCPKWS